MFATFNKKMEISYKFLHISILILNHLILINKKSISASLFLIHMKCIQLEDNKWVKVGKGGKK